MYAQNRSRVVLAAIVALAVTWPLLARADEYSQFIRAKNAYDVGEYKEAVSRFHDLLEIGLSSKALALECHKLIAVSYLFVGDQEAAEYHFSELLTISPEYSLDPMMFPIEVIDFFTEVKGKNEDRLKALARVRAQEKKRRKAIEEANKKAEFEKLRRNVYLERTYKENSLLVAMLPFGIGQFQNGHTVKGALFLGGELVLAASTVTTYFLHESLRQEAKEPFKSSYDRDDFDRREVGYRITNQASLVALSVLAVTGIIDSLYNYQSEVVTWKRVQEKDVPANLRPGKSIPDTSFVPYIGEGIIGIDIIGRF
ncbi:MAG: hypothetical protein GY847_18690 [Proteobacteria bacterium]|nr:hypothetical protein [Pseudomonadota bacterium]